MTKGNILWRVVGYLGVVEQGAVSAALHLEMFGYMVSFPHWCAGTHWASHSVTYLVCGQ